MNELPITDITAVGATVGIVVLFLRFLKEDREARDTTLRDIGKQCHDFQRDMLARHETLGVKVSQALDRNTEQIGKSSEALENCARTLAEFDSDFVQQVKDMARNQARNDRKSEQ